jgi:hypothetical protein
MVGICLFEIPFLEAWEYSKRLLTHALFWTNFLNHYCMLVSLIKRPFPLLDKTINNNINYPSQGGLQAKPENDNFKPSLGVLSLIYCCAHALTALLVSAGLLLHLGNR